MSEPETYFYGEKDRILETERLYLREMNQSDYQSLCRILQDDVAMYAYEGAFSNEEVQEWLDRQIERYQKWNFGLWAVILKETDEMIGQCGLTMQEWRGLKYWKWDIFLSGGTGIKAMQPKRREPVRNTHLKY